MFEQAFKNIDNVQEKLIEDALGATPWAPVDKPDRARCDKDPLISQAAVKDYHKSFWRQYKS